MAKEGLRPGLDTVQFQSLLAQAVMDKLNTESLYQAQVLEALAALPGFRELRMTLSLPIHFWQRNCPRRWIPARWLHAAPGAYLYQQNQILLSAANLKQIQRSWRPNLTMGQMPIRGGPA